MARGEGILIGFPQTEDPGAIATRVTEHNVTQANNLMQQRRENIRTDERQDWARQLQPYRMKQAEDEQQARQMQLDEAADQVKRTGAARDEWAALSKRFGTDNPPTAEEIMVGHANVAIASRDPAAASSAMNTLATMRQGDAKSKSLQSLVVKITPLLGDMNTPAGLAKLADILDDPEHRDALATPTYQDLQKLLFKQYEKVYPPEMAEAMQQYRLYVNQGMDRRKAWDRTLANRPELEAHIAKNGAPDEIKSLIKQEDIGDRQSDILERRKKADLEKALKLEEARARNAKERLEYGSRMRKDLAAYNAQLKQHVSKNEFKEAAGVTNQAITRVQKEIAELTKRMKRADDDELEDIQEKLNAQYAVLGPLQDRLGQLSDLATQKATGAPAGATPKVTPPVGAPTPADKKKGSEAAKKIQDTVKGLSGDKLKTKLQSILQAAIENEELSEEQAKAIYLETMRGGKK